MNTAKLRKTPENSTGLQSDQAGQIINLSNKLFPKRKLSKF